MPLILDTLESFKIFDSREQVLCAGSTVSEENKMCGFHYFSDVPKKKFLLAQNLSTLQFNSYLLHYVDDTINKDNSDEAKAAKKVHQKKFFINSKFTHSYGFVKTSAGEQEVRLEWRIKKVEMFNEQFFVIYHQD